VTTLASRPPAQNPAGGPSRSPRAALARSAVSTAPRRVCPPKPAARETNTLAGVRKKKKEHTQPAPRPPPASRRSGLPPGRSSPNKQPPSKAAAGPGAGGAAAGDVGCGSALPPGSAEPPPGRTQRRPASGAPPPSGWTLGRRQPACSKSRVVRALASFTALRTRFPLLNPRREWYGSR